MSVSWGRRCWWPTQLLPETHTHTHTSECPWSTVDRPLLADSFLAVSFPLRCLAVWALLSSNPGTPEILGIQTSRTNPAGLGKGPPGRLVHRTMWDWPPAACRVSTASVPLFLVSSCLCDLPHCPPQPPESSPCTQVFVTESALRGPPNSGSGWQLVPVHTVNKMLPEILRDAYGEAGPEPYLCEQV